MANKQLNIEINYKTNASQIDSADKKLKGLEKTTDEIQGKAKMFGSNFESSFSKTGNEADKLGRKMGSIDWGQKNLNIFGNAIKNVSGNLMSMTKYALGAAKALGALVGISGAGGMALIGKGLADYAEMDKKLQLMMNTLAPGVGKQQDNIRSAMKGTISNISAKTGASQGEVADMTTQLFSANPAFVPDQKLLGTDPDAYNKKLKETTQVITGMTEFAKAQNVEARTVLDTYVSLTASQGLDPTKLETFNYVMEQLNVTMNNSKGEMSELAPQFTKFAGEAKRAGATFEEANASFAVLTGSMGADQAADTNMAMLRTLGQGFTKSRQYANSVTEDLITSMGSTSRGDKIDVRKLLKDRKYAEAAKYIKSDASVNKDQFMELAKYSDAAEWNKINYDGTRKKTFEERMGGVLDIYGGAREKYGDAGGDILQKAVGMESSAAKGFEFVGGSPQARAQYERAKAAMNEDLKVKELGEQWKSGVITTEKYNEEMKKISTAMQIVEQHNASFSATWDRITQKVAGVSLKIGEAFAPALMAVEKVFGALNGEAVDFKQAITEGFGETAKKLDEIYPGLGAIANTMRDLILYFGSDEGKKFMSDLGTGISKVLDFMYSLLQTVSKLLSDYQGLIGWFLANPIMIPLAATGFEAIAGMITSTLTKSIIGAMTSSAVTGAIGTSIGGSVLSMVGPIAAGIVGATILYKASGQEEDLNKMAAASKVQQELQSKGIANKPAGWGSFLDNFDDQYGFETSKKLTAYAAKKVEANKKKSLLNTEGWGDVVDESYKNQGYKGVLMNEIMNNMTEEDYNNMIGESDNEEVKKQLTELRDKTRAHLASNEQIKQWAKSDTPYLGVKNIVQTVSGIISGDKEKSFNMGVDAMVKAGSLDEMDASMMKLGMNNPELEAQNDKKAAIANFLMDKGMSREDVGSLMEGYNGEKGQDLVANLLKKSSIGDKDSEFVKSQLFSDGSSNNWASKAVDWLFGKNQTKQADDIYTAVKDGVKDSDLKPEITITNHITGNVDVNSEVATSESGSPQKQMSLMDFVGSTMKSVQSLLS